MRSKKPREAHDIRCAAAPYFVGPKLSRPYHFRARIGHFQWLAAQFPGGLPAARKMRRAVAVEPAGRLHQRRDRADVGDLLARHFQRWRQPGKLQMRVSFSISRRKTSETVWRARFGFSLFFAGGFCSVPASMPAPHSRCVSRRREREHNMNFDG